MRRCNGLLKIMLMGGCMGLPMFAWAQNADVAVFNGPNNDFLLPSYFDGPAPVVVTQQTVVEPVRPAATQSIPSDVDILNEIFGEQTQTKTSAPQSGSAPKTRHTFYPTPKVQEASSAPLLTPLDPIPPTMEPDLPPPEKSQYKSAHAAKLLAQESMGKGKASVQVPKEMRLTFDHHSAQLSESVAKWIKAYALHVQKDPRLVLNIRISNQDWPLQRARLGLIMKLLVEQGLSTKQIRIFQSDRDVDSVLLNADTDPNQTQIIVPTDTKRVIREQKNLIW